MSIHPLSMVSVSQHLQSHALMDSIPKIHDIHERFANRSCLHRHLAKERYSLVTSFLVKPVLTSIMVPLMLSCLLIHKIGLKILAKKLYDCIMLLRDYAASNSSLKPLVRTINSAREIDPDELFSKERSGICAGASLYFNYLVTIFTKDASNLNDDTFENLLIKIANIFVKGGPKQAESIHGAFGSIFDSKQKFYQKCQPHLLDLVPDDNQSILKRGEIVYKNRDEIKKLANAPYTVRIFNASGYHVLSLIKVSNTRVYIFDPAIGLFKFDGENIPEQINDYLNNAYRDVHKYYYYSAQRAKQAVNPNGEIIPSDVEEFYTQIVPYASDSNLPTFNSQIPANNQRFTRYPANIWGHLQCLRDSTVDSIKSSDFASFFGY